MRRKESMKLTTRYYYEPFKAIGRWNEVMYVLQLSPTSKLHPVFYVPWLKKRVGDPSLVTKELPHFDDEGKMLL